MNQTVIVGVSAFLLAILTGPLRAAGYESLSASARKAFQASADASQWKGTVLPEARPAYGSPQDQLMDLLDDPDPGVRAQAAKSLRHYALTDSRVEDKLLAVIDRRNEADSVRREAVKSLAWSNQRFNVLNRTVALARSERETSDIRAIALKSLYPVANRYEARQPLQDALRGGKDPEARKAAAWALYADNPDYTTRRLLVETATDSSEPVALRVEAVKSLFGAMLNFDVERPVTDLAKSSSADAALREAAILSLLMKNQDWSVRSYLEETAKSNPNPVLRQAAIKAMGGLTLELVRYFHLSRYRGEFIDPLEDQ